MTKTSIIILAAGKGTRMKSDLPKVMHKVAGLEMLNMVISAASELNLQEISIVVSEEFTQFEQKIFDQNPNINLSFVTQIERSGTGNAAFVGFKSLTKPADKILVLYGDTPLLKKETLQEMTKALDDSKVSVLGFECFDENQYGKLVIDENGALDRIVENKDANEEERQIELCNSGVVAVDGSKFEEFLSKIDNDNAAGEYYLTDVVKIARQGGFTCSYIVTGDEEVLGVNSKIELARVERIKQDELRLFHLQNGVTIIDPASVYFAADTKIGNDCIIHPNVVFGAGVEIASGVEVKAFSHIEKSKIDSRAIVGPFARIRPGSQIGEEVRIGNFVEVKNSTLKKGSKVNHLSYVGDSEIGKNSNIGAGVITCNYDGYSKSATIIGEGAFVGSNSALVAPLNVADGALIAAGSVVTQDVAVDDLVLARSEQKNIENGAKKFRDKKNGS